jgi:hypothetical protein
LKILVTILALSISPHLAFGAPKKITKFSCTMTAATAKTTAYDSTLEIEVLKNGETVKVTRVYGKSFNPKVFKPLTDTFESDDHDSSHDADHGEEGYNLDEKYDRTKEARFIGIPDFSTSDVDSCLFAAKSILDGLPGEVSISGASENDTVPGGYSWERVASFDCTAAK